MAAIARHRRASWRVTAACAVAVAVLTLAVAIHGPRRLPARGVSAALSMLFTVAPAAVVHLVLRWVAR